jgi:hypothetical protein
MGLGPPDRVGAADVQLPSLEGIHLGDILSAFDMRK